MSHSTSTAPLEPAATAIDPVDAPATPPSSSSRPRQQQRKPALMRPGIRNELVAFAAELAGTFLFLFMSFTALQTAQDRKAANDGIGEDAKPDIAMLLYVAMAFGFSLSVNCWAFYRVSGGMFNPAVALALFLARAITPLRLAVVVAAQLVAGIAVSWVLEALLPGDLAVGTTLAPGVNTAQGLFIEMFLTLQLCLTILLLAVEKHKATFLAPVGIGFSLFIGHLAGVYFTGAGINPCRSFGPATVEGFPGNHWIYWLGPAMGAALASGLWWGLRKMEYQTVNPGQDFDELEAGKFEVPEWAGAEDVRRPVVCGAREVPVVKNGTSN